MKLIRHTFLGTIVVLAALWHLTTLAQEGQHLAFRHAAVIDGLGGQVKTDHAVLVRDGRIIEVSPEHLFEMPAGSIEHDVSGLYLLPGFIDTHVHSVWGPVSVKDVNGLPQMQLIADPEISAAFIKPLLASGITTIRNPGGATEQTVAQRSESRTRQFDYPRIFTAGEVIDIFPGPGLVAGVSSVDEMRDEVTRQAALGVDMVKFYTGINPELLEAGIETADSYGLRTIGHLFATDWGTAANLGIDSIVHALPSAPAMLPASRVPEYLAAIQGTQFLFQWFEYADFEDPAFTSAIEAMRKADTDFDPTLVAVEGMFLGDQPSVKDNPNLDSVPEQVRRDWQNSAGLTAQWSAEDFERARNQWPRVLEMVKRIYQAGVTITAGTDVANPNVIPGHSFHRELELLVDAGIPTSHVLRIATMNGAIALGQGEMLGSISEGKVADMVILSANPLQDIRNTRRIVSVIKSGRMIDIVGGR